ncbi:kinase-like domain-containing protein [Jimgerdemannia flammicorona]|uniref:Kinase-like domain-containing protein n=1 Tax=Jimgerdemannia flammicorona TaxID=994334 RepID=A0A433D985_9FUNG|nr:kinase-like domain-containing protein [Jimgerdemannia flammicorona]
MEEVNARFRRELRTIDVLYMLDCTVSMKPWIRAAASKVSEVAHHLAAQFPTYTIRYGFLGYRDFENSPKDRFVEMPFTDRIVDLQAVLDATRAIGNTDDAEDVVGALAKAVKFEWKARTRVLYHFADCPSHFKKFHDGIKDHYPEVDPDGRSSVDAEKLLRKMGNLGVDYYFVQIKKKRTAKMVTEFKKIYDNDAEDRKLQILDLGSDTTKFLPTVVNTIASSVAKSTRCDQTQTLIATYVHPLHPPYTTNIYILHYLTHHPSFPPTHRSILDPDVTILPKIDWDRASEGWGQLIRMESIACNLQRPLESVIRAPLEDLLADHIQAYIRPEPFAKGGVRYALPMFQPKDNRKLVAKTFRHGAREMSRFFEVMATQAIATKLVSEFNRHNPVRPMGFIDVRVVEVRPPEPATGTEGLYFTVEPFIEGEYVRHNNNAGWSNEAKATAQAFSHFSWIASGKRLVVVDLQGVEYVMTDPVIHSVKEPHFGPTDFAQQGINLFFASHRCNFVCAQLNLPPHPLQPSSPLSIATDSLLQELELSGPRQVNCGAVGCPAFVDIGIDGMLGVARTICVRRRRMWRRV